MEDDITVNDARALTRSYSMRRDICQAIRRASSKGQWEVKWNFGSNGRRLDDVEWLRSRGFRVVPWRVDQVTIDWKEI